MMFMGESNVLVKLIKVLKSNEKVVIGYGSLNRFAGNELRC